METENYFELTSEADKSLFHRMAKVHDYLEMRLGSNNLLATQKNSQAHNKQITAIGYISDTEEIIIASLIDSAKMRVK